MCFRKWVVLALLVLAPMFARAAPQCSVSASGMSFGAYSPALLTPLDGIASVQVDCEVNTVYTVESSTVQMNPDGTREMKAGGGAATVALYFLYIDPARTQVWGDGTGNTYAINGISAGTVIDIPIYGRVPARQQLGAGDYSDKVLVRINF